MYKKARVKNRLRKESDKRTYLREQMTQVNISIHPYTFVCVFWSCDSMIVLYYLKYNYSSLLLVSYYTYIIS